MLRPPMRHPQALIGVAVLAVAGVTSVWLVVRASLGQRHNPARCAPGFAASGYRCCVAGQTLGDDGCVGDSPRCPSPMEHVKFPRSGCVMPAQRIRIEGGKLTLSPSDWEAEGQLSPRTFAVQSFAIDSAEVTIERWTQCVAEGRCTPQVSLEPGLPVTNVRPLEAERFCQSVGGRLPTRDEWIFAAAGAGGRRYPWGQTGLVCRRAAFGLVNGPCGHGATGPDLAGARPDGRSPDGVFDLSGNVAEWAKQPDGTFRARGGSYRSTLAGELKSWAEEALPDADRAPHVGFRCAYDLPG